MAADWAVDPVARGNALARRVPSASVAAERPRSQRKGHNKKEGCDVIMVES